MKPFLKWAGSKYRLLSTIQQLLPKGQRLIEPFVGSGAVFLNLDFSDYLLNDSNADLINLFQVLAAHGNQFIQDTQCYFIPQNNTQESFIRLRQQFNTTKDSYEKAILFIYLNRHGYNGLCRYNSKGIFNVPFGRYTKPHFPAEQLLNFYHKTKSVSFHCYDFRRIFQLAKPGDVIYCDPPYVPFASSKVIRYQSTIFVEDDQIELAKLAYEASCQGIPVLLSNHDTPFTRKIYSQAKLHKLSVSRFISCKSNERTPAKELLALFGG